MDALRLRLSGVARGAARLAVLLPGLLFLAAPTHPARAIEEVVFGPAAIAPAASGGPASASAASSDASNRAQATGGEGGEPAPPVAGGRGGDATAHAATDTSGPASAEAIARGGQGGSEIPVGGPAAEGGAGGDALASATARNDTADPVNVTASAFGGFGGDAEEFFSPGVGGDGGDARLGMVEGISTGGGDVTVTGLAVGGAGGIGATPGRSANAILENAVRGETSGNLVLRQAAEAGGGRVEPGVGGAGSEADATASLLSHTGASESLELDARALARPTSNVTRTSVPSTSAGRDARATATGSNTGGSVLLNALALGGTAVTASGDSTPVEGGDARVRAEGEVWGDGHRLVIGSTGGDETESGGAFGGRFGTVPVRYGAFAGDAEVPFADGVFGDGGDATSHSTGIAHGDSEVIVRDQARGGSPTPLVRRVPPQVPGKGGSASSFALARNAGSSRVEAESLATGGGAVFDAVRQNASVDGGDASAEAMAFGRGESVARARAAGGTSRFSSGGAPEASTTAVARAFAQGASGSATAEAGQRVLPPGDATRGSVALRTRAIAAVVEAGRSEARVGSGLALSHGIRLPGVDSAAYGVAAPGDAAVARSLAGEPEVAAAFEAMGVTVVEALGRFGLGDSVGREDSILLSAEMELELPASPSPGDLAQTPLAVGFLAPEGIAGEGFGSLTLRLEDLGGEVLREYVFGDLAEAVSFLAGRALELPASELVSDPELVPSFAPDPFDRSGSDFGRVGFVHDRFGLRVVLELDAAPEAAFGLGVAVGRIAALPEPGVALLLGLGLMLVAARRRGAG